MYELRMISNTEEDHLDELRKMLNSNVEHLVIASPFLAGNMSELLNDLSFKSVKLFELITTFKPKDPEQLTKPFVLKELFEYFANHYPDTKLIIHVDNRLHGKIYLATYHLSKKMIVSSANFTKSGLRHNHEWGLATNDERIIDEVFNDLFKAIEYHDITYTQINRACSFADQYLRMNPEWDRKPDIHTDILESVYSVDDDSNTNPQYFLKPVGVTESPILIENKRDFSNLHENLHFSKKKPKDVRKGDYLITVAVTAGSLLSYYKVTGGLQKVNQQEIAREPWKERWPWYMEGRNLSPQFGGSWWIHNIQRKDVLSRFLEQYPNVPVTSAGGFSLGTLNYGNDKVKITKEFGDFLISTIKNACSK